MFDALRKMIFPIIIVVLVFFVAMIVLQWGAGMSSRQDYDTRNLAAVINGEEISWQEYSRVYDRLLRTQTQDREEDLSDQEVEKLQRDAWDQLLADRLLLQEVQKYGITATDEELYSYLRMSPPMEIRQLASFQTEGQFDYQKYMQALANPQMSQYWAALEPELRRDISKMKLQEMVMMTVQVTDQEVRDFFMAQNEQVKVGVVNVDYSRFSKPPPTNSEEELLAYFEEHRDDYPVDERASLRTAVLNLEPSELDWERARQLARQVYDSAQAGADFTELAQVYSEDPGSARNGGDLGWFAQGRMVPSFDSTVFAMDVGSISEPVRSRFGWHVIKLHDRKQEKEESPGGKEAKVVEKAHASHVLIKVVASQDTRDDIYNRIDGFRSIAVNEGFDAASEQTGIEVNESGLFSKGRAIDGIGRNVAAQEFAFTSKVDAISEIIENRGQVFVVQLIETVPAGLADFEDVRQQVELAVSKDKVAGICRDTASAIWADVQAGADLKDAAQTHGETYDLPEAFKRDSYVKELGRDPMAIGAAFALTEPGQMSGPVDHGQGTAILKLLERTSPDLTQFTEQRDSLRTALLGQKQQSAFGRWYEMVRNGAEVENNVFRMLNQAREYM